MKILTFVDFRDVKNCIPEDPESIFITLLKVSTMG